MQKIQILFPDPIMRELRAAAAREDRPVSELVRRAVERMLEQGGSVPRQPRPFPVFNGGEIKIDAENMKEAIYANE